MVKGCSGELI